MATEIVMPQMGAEMEEGTVLKWLKQPGDTVNRGDMIAEIETDKATVELESFEAGTFLQAVVEEGTTVPVGQVIAYLGQPGEQAPGAPSGGQPSATGAPPPARSTANGSAAPSGRESAPAAGAARPGVGEGGLPAESSVTANSERPESVDIGARDTGDDAQRSERFSAPAQPSAAGPVSAAQPAAASRAGEVRDSLRRDGVRLRVSPVARSMAEELGVDLTLI